jgi:hypothetical protein
VSSVQTQRAQVLTRVSSAEILLGSTLLKFVELNKNLDSAKSVEEGGAVNILSKIRTEARLMDSWVKGNSGILYEVNANWFADAHECTRVRGLLDNLVNVGQDWDWGFMLVLLVAHWLCCLAPCLKVRIVWRFVGEISSMSFISCWFSGPSPEGRGSLTTCCSDQCDLKP